MPLVEAESQSKECHVQKCGSATWQHNFAAGQKHDLNHEWKLRSIHSGSLTLPQVHGEDSWEDIGLQLEEAVVHRSKFA